MMTLNLEITPPLLLRAETAGDLMTPNPVSLRADATLREAIALLTDKGYSAAPVIDDAGLPVGVLSRSDILVHDREAVAYAGIPPYYADEEPVLPTGERLGGGFQVEVTDQTRVCDLMTPVVFAVAPDTPAPDVVREMLKLKVHRLFVVDDSGVLVGVISTQDVLRHLGPTRE
jgi:CBS domain-containing protein